MPGGAVNLRESVAQAAIMRKSREEMGIVCGITGLVGACPVPAT
ncbi:NUDIX hydrolase [Spirillospora sp. NBC_01491]